MVLYGFTLEMSLREGHGHRQASAAAYLASQNRQLGLFAPVYPAPWRHSGVKQVAAHCQPCSLLHLGNRVYAAFSNTAGQILDSLEVRIKKKKKDASEGRCFSFCFGEHGAPHKCLGCIRFVFRSAPRFLFHLCAQAALTLY